MRDTTNRAVGSKVLYIDVSDYVQLQRELDDSRNELETSFEELQSTNEELETTNEELQSTIEELETTNEELQSTNEELETMNEELQSGNEELEALTDEMRMRTEELHRANSYMDAVLRSMRVGAVVLDDNSEVQTWNEGSEKLWGLRADEAEGKNFFMLDIGLPVAELREMVRESLNNPDGRREIGVMARDRRGKQINCRVQSLPLTDGDRKVTGVALLVYDDDEVDGAGTVRERRPKNP